MKKAAKKPGKPVPSTATPNSWEFQEKALKDFERGVMALGKQNYAGALEHFQAIVDGFPKEKELLDRAQVYIRICKGMADQKPAQPRKPDEFFYYGVMKANDAEYEEAVKYLDRALEANPKDEKVHYVLASTLALKGDRQDALKHLREAVELNATNRVYARNDPDFEPLREDEDFMNLIHPEEA